MGSDSMAKKREREDFDLAGPTNLTPINWNCPNEQRKVVACLVRGVYILELDRLGNRQGPNALAPTWWERFDFRLYNKFHDDFDSTIAGAIYEYNPISSASRADPAAPKYIFAFRGTMKKRETIMRDLVLNLRTLNNSLHKTSRYQKALEILSALCSKVGYENVWLGGHSLGASLATLAGKHFAKQDTHLKSFLFNPPFPTSPIEMIPGIVNDKMKDKMRSAKKKFRVGVANIMKSHETKTAESFEKLAPWVPHVFLNPGDPICSEYINYFQERKMETEQSDDEKSASSHLSFRDMCWNLVGVESERLYLLPSARVTVNRSNSTNDSWKLCHEIDQWWQTDLNLETCHLSNQA